MPPEIEQHHLAPIVAQLEPLAVDVLARDLRGWLAGQQVTELEEIRVNQRFKVSVSVVNSSQSRQSFRVTNGSWEMHWTCSNERVHWFPQPVTRNFIETVTLEPGKAYQQTGSMILVPGKPQKEVTFKLGFTPEGSKETYWSKEVTLQVEAD